MKYLDYAGLEYLISELKDKFIQKEAGRGLSENDFTHVLKEKLESIEAGAEKNKIESVNGKIGVVQITSSDIKHLSTITGEDQKSISDLIDGIIKNQETMIENLKEAVKKDDVYSKEQIDEKLGSIDGGVISVNGKTGVVSLDTRDLNHYSAEKTESLHEYLLEIENEKKNIGKELEEQKNLLKELESNKAERKYVESALKGKVDFVPGKTLSANDFSDSYKNKLENIEESAEKNVIELIKRNGINVQVVDKGVDINVPTKTSEMINDTQFQTKLEVVNLIREQGRIRKQIVDKLPSVSEADDYTLYLIQNKNQTGYEEWFIVGGQWEIVGDTAAVDLTDYLQKKELSPISKEEIDNFLE